MTDTLTRVQLCAVPIERDYKHTLYFADTATQKAYFDGKTKKSATECSYQRREKMVRFPAKYDDIVNCNYLMYQNSNTGNRSKWYYAFITKMEYKNDEMTEIYFEIDVMQTWLRNEDYVVNPSFIEREHVINDNIGANTVPENLETGDYVINNMNKNSSLLTNSLIMGCTVDLNKIDEGVLSDKYEPAGGGMYNGIYSGIKYL